MFDRRIIMSVLTYSKHTHMHTQSRGYGGEEAAVGEGAPIAYSTGIAEVALPIEFKLRNIEATEAAQRALQEKGKAAPEEIGAWVVLVGLVLV